MKQQRRVGRQTTPVVRFSPQEEAGLVLSEHRRFHRALNITPDMIELLSMPVPMDFYALLGMDFEEEHARPLIINGSMFNSLFGMENSSSLDSLTSLDSLDGGPAGPFEQLLKHKYRQLQKLVHPDHAGEVATEMAALVNLAFRTLSDPDARAAYDVDLRGFRQGVGAFDGRPVSFWAGVEGETRAVFVDEAACIGCMQCTMVAPNTFKMEDEWGRARVHTQWADEEEHILEAVGACPVDCIYTTDRSTLPLLEFVMKSCKRENVALMGRRRSGNMGSGPSTENPFVKAEAFLTQRQRSGKTLDQVYSSLAARVQDDELAAAISRAWLNLPDHVRCKGWPRWAAKVAEAEAAAQSLA